MPICTGCYEPFDEEDYNEVGRDYNESPDLCPSCSGQSDEEKDEEKYGISIEEVEGEIRHAEYESKCDALEQQARLLGKTLVFPEDIGEGLRHRDYLIMTQATTLSPGERADIASAVFEYMQECTASLTRRMGFELAYLMGAFARNVQIRLARPTLLIRHLLESPHWQAVRPFICSLTITELPPSPGLDDMREHRRVKEEKKLGVKIEVVKRKLESEDEYPSE